MEKKSKSIRTARGQLSRCDLWTVAKCCHRRCEGIYDKCNSSAGPRVLWLCVSRKSLQKL